MDEQGLSITEVSSHLKHISQRVIRSASCRLLWRGFYCIPCHPFIFLKGGALETGVNGRLPLLSGVWWYIISGSSSGLVRRFLLSSVI